MLIVEGPDGGGKSTVVKGLADRLGLVIINNRSKPRSLYQIVEYTEDVIDLAEKQAIISDRWPAISEWVYGNVIRGHSVITWDQVRQNAQELSSICGGIIYCRPDQLKISTKPQMEGVVENLPALVKSYDDIMLLLAEELSVVTYDYTRHHLTNLIELLEEQS